MDGWNTIVAFSDSLFSGAMLVLGSVREYQYALDSHPTQGAIVTTKILYFSIGNPDLNCSFDTASGLGG